LPRYVKKDVIHKTGSTYRIALSLEEDRATGNTYTEDFVKFGRVVSEVCK